MLCRLKVKRAQDLRENVFPFELRLVARPAVGGAGHAMEDAVGFSTHQALVQALRDLQIGEESIAQAENLLDDDAKTGRWLAVGVELQISLQMISEAGFYLHTHDD